MANARNVRPIPKESEFSACEERLAALLSRGSTHAAAAAELAISPRTIYRKMSDPNFRALVSQLRTRMMGEAVGQLSAIMSEAVAEVHKLLKDERPDIRSRAISTIFDQVKSLGTYADLAGRIEELERRAADAKPTRQD